MLSFRQLFLVLHLYKNLENFYFYSFLFIYIFLFINCVILFIILYLLFCTWSFSEEYVFYVKVLNADPWIIKAWKRRLTGGMNPGCVCT